MRRANSLVQLSTLIEHSDACNGLMFDDQGRLLACQGETKRLIRIDTRKKEHALLADKWADKPLGTPNDRVIDRQGGVYFTAAEVKQRVIDNLASNREHGRGS